MPCSEGPFALLFGDFSSSGKEYRRHLISAGVCSRNPCRYKNLWAFKPVDLGHSPSSQPSNLTRTVLSSGLEASLEVCRGHTQPPAASECPFWVKLPVFRRHSDAPRGHQWWCTASVDLRKHSPAPVASKWFRWALSLQVQDLRILKSVGFKCAYIGGPHILSR